MIKHKKIENESNKGVKKQIIYLKCHKLDLN